MDTLELKDPKSTALILIDLQQGIVARQLAPHSSADVIKNSVRREPHSCSLIA